MSIGLLGTNFSENSIEILIFSFKKMRFKMLSTKVAAILSRRRWLNFIPGNHIPTDVCTRYGMSKFLWQASHREALIFFQWYFKTKILYFHDNSKHHKIPKTHTVQQVTYMVSLHTLQATAILGCFLESVFLRISLQSSHLICWIVYQ